MQLSLAEKTVGCKTEKSQKKIRISNCFNNMPLNDFSTNTTRNLYFATKD